MPATRWLLVLGALLALPLAAAVADDGGTGPAYSGTAIKTLTATLVDGTGAHLGFVQLNQDANGVVKLQIDVSKLPAGPHGIHVHAVGKCEGPAFTSAGGHFNPDGKQHGLDNPAGPHAGDLHQIDEHTVEVDYYHATTNRISLLPGAKNSIYDADGTALIVHAGADDQVTDPTGNSGARIGCALLAAPNPALATPTATAVVPKPPATGSGAASAGGSMSAIAIVAGAILVAMTATALVTARRRS